MVKVETLAKRKVTAPEIDGMGRRSRLVFKLVIIKEIIGRPTRTPTHKSHAFYDTSGKVL